MTKLLLLPIRLPLKIAALELRLARAAAERSLALAREVGGLGPDTPARAPASAPPPAPVPTPGARPPAPAAADAPPSGRDMPAAAVSAERPRPATPRRTARRATAERPARRRESGPTRGEAAAIREAQREAEAAAGGTDPGPGPQINVQQPWDGYDGMRLDEVLARLEAASEAELAIVRLYESQNENRQAVLLATGQEP